MTKEYRINLKYQIKSISNGFFQIWIVPVILFIAWFLDGFYPDTPLIIGLIIWTLIWFIPVFLLHTLYFRINRQTILTIDENEKRIKISENGTQVVFNFDDVSTSERIYFSDYKHDKWQQNWFPMPWRNYGLLRILTKDNQEYFFTSLMIDITNPPIKPFKNTFKFIPFPPKTFEMKHTETIEKEKLARKNIDFFKMRFKDRNVPKLINMLDTEELVDEANKAIEELIEEKNKAANIG